MGDRLVQAIILVEDLAAARCRMEAIGLAVAGGGRHPGRGTANLIVPFGAEYLELLAIVDAEEAAASAQGRPVLEALATRGPGLARWSVESPDIAASSARLGLPVERRHRIRPDGTTIAWQSVGVDIAWAEPWRCAFMSWDDPALHPARSTVPHPNGARGIARLEVAAPDLGALVDWLGGDVPPGVALTVGDTGPLALTLDSAAGPIPVP